MTTREPIPRLDRSSDDPVLKEALASARRDLPGDARMNALAAGFAAKLGASGAGGASGASGTSGTSTATTTATGLGAGAKGVGIVASAIVAASAVWYATRPAPETAPASPPPPAITVTHRATPTPPPVQTSDPIPTVSVEELPTTPPVASPRASASAAVPRESDTALLGRAQKELGANPARALTLLDEHAKTFPRSGFGQEREVLTIDALLRLGRRGEAESRAAQFATAYPKSAHNRRIDALLGR
jgi:hypothetical protein